MKPVLLLFLFGALFMACNPKVIPTSNDSAILGTWVFEYQIMENREKSDRPPYMLLEYDYSDGIALFANQKGCRVYGGEPDTLQQFHWSIENSQLRVSLDRASSLGQEFIYKISNQTVSSMTFETPKGYQYILKKQ